MASWFTARPERRGLWLVLAAGWLAIGAWWLGSDDVTIAVACAMFAGYWVVLWVASGRGGSPD